MALRVREWLFSNGTYGWVPAGAGPFGAVLVVHGPSWEAAGWCNRDALLFAAHDLVGMPAYNDPAGALAALRKARFVSGRIGVFVMGDGAAMMPDLLASGHVDAIAFHGAAPVDVDAATAQGVPLFLSHGEADERFPVDTSKALEQAQLAKGGVVEAYYYSGMDHGLNDQDVANSNTARFVDFLCRHLQIGR